MRQEAQRKKYAIKFFNSEGGVFYKPGFGNGLQRVAWVNTAHPFFKVFYTEIAKTGNPRARQVIDLLLLGARSRAGTRRRPRRHQKAFLRVPARESLEPVPEVGPLGP